MIDIWNRASKRESESIIRSLYGFIKMGEPLSIAIKTLGDISRGKTKRLLKRAEYLIVKKNMRPEEVLQKMGIINKTEEIILIHNKDIKKSFEDIIIMRNTEGRFDKTLLSLTVFPMISVIIGLFVAQFLLPKFSEPLEAIVKIAKVSKGIDLDPYSDIPEMFWYIFHPDLITPVLIGYIITVILMIVSYIYLSEYKPAILYKIFRLKSYDDVPFIFMMMRSLHNTGIPPVKIAEILSKHGVKPGWKLFFRNLRKNISSGRSIYQEFEKFGIPQEITTIVKSAEIGKSFWDNIDQLIEYVLYKNRDGNEMLLKYFGGLSTVIGYSIVIFFLVGVFILMLQIQTISTALIG